MYGKRAEVIDRFFRKGSEIVVSGRMESYKPKNDPNRTAWLVKMSGFDFAGKSGNGSGSSNSSSANTRPAPAQAAPQQSEPRQTSFDDMPDSFEQMEEDIPF